ncbi:MAG: hypothetical protein RLZZ452_1369 [Pseudomonadota bacterium]
MTENTEICRINADGTTTYYWDNIEAQAQRWQPGCDDFSVNLSKLLLPLRPSREWVGLTDAQQDWSEVEALRESLREHMAEIHRLRSELAMQRLTDVQQEMEQEPAIYPEEARDMGLEEIPYYTRPSRREWVGLTLEEVQDSYNADYQAQTRAIESKLKEKNT